MPPTPALREALNGSITSGHFADTKIYLFSHRNSSGDVCKPKILYANSGVLRSVPYFNDLFSGNYSETTTKDLGEDIANEDAIAEHYDYDSDSDLEDAEDLKPTEKPSPLLRGHLFDPFCFAPDETDSPESSNDGTADGKPQDTVGEDHVPSYYEERMKEGKVIKVQDVAFITFQAFLFYLYTDYIGFAPFGSKANRKARAAEIASLVPDHVPRPSPKSIYRLADKYDVPALKAVALEQIQEGLGRCDAVRETFNRFTSHYPEILELHVENLTSILTEVGSGEIQDQLDERLRAFAEGEIDHASEAFSSLWKVLTSSRSGEVFRPSSLPPYPPAESSSLEIALIRSIRQGSFCDRKYLASRDHSGKRRVPVYFSSIVLGGTEPALNALTRIPRGSGAGETEDECDSDSDYEDTVERTAASAQEDTARHSEQECKSGVAVTLSTGAFTTWRALFFLLYTEDVNFAPLKSQGSEARMHYVRANIGPRDPPPCSPKSICYLAGKLGLLRLKTAALKDVATKTSATNIVRETFSKSTARLPDVRKMQCQLLASSSRSEDVRALAEQHIRGLAGGQTPHCYAALSLGFRMAVEEKRKNPSLGVTGTAPPTGPTICRSKLRCPMCGVRLTKHGRRACTTGSN